MSFNYSIDSAINRAQSALNQLGQYRYDQPARSYPNSEIRNNARLTIDPAVYDVRNAANYEGGWGVSQRDRYEARQGAELLRQATFALSDKLDIGRPANVSLAQSQIRDAISWLRNARW